MSLETLPELMRELGALVSAVALALCGQLLAGSQRRQYAIGALTATCVSVALWMLAQLSFVVPAWSPGPGVFLVIVAPVAEEATRAFAVYSLLPRFSARWRGFLAFAVGYASIEAIYKAILTVTSPHVEWRAPEFVALASLPPFFLLVFLGVMMCFLRDIGVKGPHAFFCCLAVHVAHNALPAFIDVSGAWEVYAAVRVALFGGASILLLAYLSHRSRNIAGA